MLVFGRDVQRQRPAHPDHGLGGSAFLMGEVPLYPRLCLFGPTNSLTIADERADMLRLRYKTGNFRARKSLGAQNW